MKSNKSDVTDRKLLRTAFPKLYSHLIEELASQHIHAYDVTASYRYVETGVEIQVCFGEGFTQEITRIFPIEKLNENNSEFTNFCKEVGETSKETLIADYFKMVKP